MSQKHSKHTFPLNELNGSNHDITILQMHLNIDNQQMYGGANQNDTNDKTNICNFTQLPPIPIYGVDKQTTACHIIGKGITELDTLGGSTLEIQMFYSPHCSGTIISPNAIVQQSTTFTSWIQTSHLDTGTANILLFFHQTDFTKNKIILLSLHNNLWFINQSYFLLVSKANKAEICLITDDEIHSPHICIQKLHKSTQ